MTIQTITNLTINEIDINEISINATTASTPGRSFIDSMSLLSTGIKDTFLGDISINEVQLCPQTNTISTIDDFNFLMENYIHTKFRLHADVKLVGRYKPADLCYFDISNKYDKNWKCIADMSNYINAPAYSLHSGKRVCSLEELYEKYYHLQDLFNCPIAIEGHYPSRTDYLFNSWQEYSSLLIKNVYYVIDLSHLHILSVKGWEDNLIKELLNNPRCIEVHFSGNNKRTDSHEELLAEPEWWKYTKYINKNAKIFYEGRVNNWREVL